MGGEQAVKIGNDGEKMMREFLKLVGWNNLSQNEHFQCSLGKKHKLTRSKSLKETHNIDATFYYNNPLNHSDTDIILCSSKHNQDEYSDKSKAYAHLKELAYSLECAPNDFSFANSFENKDKNKVFKGLLFWVSSNQNEQKESMIDKISGGLIQDEEDVTQIGKLRGIPYNSIYLLDNQKVTFISSAIKTAKNLFPSSGINFLFPHTGYNNRTEDISAYGEIMPIQYINTSLLPIVLEHADNISVLIFCDSNFDKEYLKRIIWLANKISNLVSEVLIYFNDYDTTNHLALENKVKQLFQSSHLTAKISVRKVQPFDFITLKEEQSFFLSNGQSRIRTKRELKLLPSSGDLDQVLPFGEMIKPIISSTVLSDNDIKAFLVRKGIYIGNKEKQSTVPLLSTLLLSPEELNTLKDLLKLKEEKVKSVPRDSELSTNDISIENIGIIINNSLNQNKNLWNLPANCTFFEEPKIEKNADEIKVSFILEKQNTTKDLITGKQHNEGYLTFKKSKNNRFESRLNYTSRETYKCANNVFKYIEDDLIKQSIITKEFAGILFSSFENNVQRINFFLSFLNTNGELLFKEAQLEHIVVKPDNTLDEKLPFDLESLKNRVNKLAISGKALDSVHYFLDSHKKALLMQQVKIKYDFDYGIEKGKCIIDLDFKNAFENGDSETNLQFNIELLKGRNYRGKNTEKILSFLNKSFNEFVQKKYKEQVIDKRVKQQPNSAKLALR